MRALMTATMLMVLFTMYLVIKNQELYENYRHSFVSRSSSQSPVSLLIETPKAQQYHYIKTNNTVETTYPSRFSAQTLSSGDIQDRLLLLPVQDRERDSYLIVSRLGMIVPVVTLSSETSLVSKITQSALQSGAVLHPRASGQSLVIGGHTSSLINDVGSYKTIFQSLVVLQDGDIISLYKRNGPDNWSHQDYKFLSREIVSPEQTEIINQGNSDKLILYGCYPFGSTKERVVVEAIAL